MNICLRYPIKRCHFCDQIMLYNRYEMGGNYIYCNNDKSCMGMIYTIDDDKIKIKEFTIGDMTLLYFKVFSTLTDNQCKNTLLIRHDDGPHEVKDIFEVDINTILDKEKSLKLLKKIHKTILLSD